MTTRTLVGLVITATWIFSGLIYGVVCRSALLAMSPNEFGDFLAGAFSPLAFLWLIIGYMQQGEELNLNTQALKLQADELKQSVEQQRQLVEVTREQMTEDREKYKQEQERLTAAAEPKFMFAHNGAKLSAGNAESKIKIANAGGCARPLSVFLIEESGSERHIFTIPILDTGAEREFTLQNNLFQDHEQLKDFLLKYRDSWGQPGSKKFQARVDEHQKIAFKKIES